MPFTFIQYYRNIVSFKNLEAELFKGYQLIEKKIGIVFQNYIKISNFYYSLEKL